MRRSKFMLAILLTVVLALAGCGGDDDGNADDLENETPTPVETPTPEPETDDEAADPQETPEAEAEVPSERRIQPHDVMLIAESGEQTGQIGPYFWTNEDLELAAEVQGGFFELQDEPLVVSQGEELRIETSEDFPDEMTLEVFPPTEPEEANLAELEPEAQESEELDPGTETWTVDLEPGEYYIQLQTVWPTEEVWGRDRTVAYRFWLQVE